MHAIHPDALPEQSTETCVFKTLLPPALGGSLAAYLLTVTKDDLHSHEHEDQVYIIQSGRGMMRIGDQEREVGPGCLVHIPRGQPHALRPLDGKPIVLYSLMYRSP